MMIQMDSNKLMLREGLLSCIRIGEREREEDGAVTCPIEDTGKEVVLFCEEHSLKTGMNMRAIVKQEHLETFHIGTEEAWERAFLNEETRAAYEREHAAEA